MGVWGKGKNPFSKGFFSSPTLFSPTTSSNAATAPDGRENRTALFPPSPLYSHCCFGYMLGELIQIAKESVGYVGY